MADFLLDNLTHDLTFSEGSLVFNDGDVEVAQRVEIRLKTQKEEWLFDQDMGIKYFDVDADGQAVLVKNPDLRLIHDFYVEEISKVETVREILKVDLEVKDRTLSTEIFIVSIYGNTITIGA